MKKLIATALLAVLALTGCSAAATPAPSGTAATPPALAVTKPTDAQKAALMADLVKVNPQFDGTRALIGAGLACRSILKGEPGRGQVMTVQDRFSRAADRPVTEADAKRIIEIIKTNGFCVKA